MPSSSSTLLTAAIVTITLSAVLPPPAQAETPAAYCRRITTDDAARPIPATLVPAVNTAFALHLPAQVAVETTVFRCAEGHVLVCTAGANLPCGKANTAPTPTAAIGQWCRTNPDAAYVPAVVTGHDSIYDWRCHAGIPHTAGPPRAIDARGFIAQYWKQLP